MAQPPAPPLTLVLTRPRDDSLALARHLEAQGYRCLVEPLLEVMQIDAPPPSQGGVQALLLTSARAAPALAGFGPELPVFTVGDATAQAASRHYRGLVRSAGGAAADLARLVRGTLDPEGGALLHLAGRDVRPELGRALEAAGFEFRRAVVYRAEPAERLSDGFASALAGRAVDAILLFSPRTARTLARLVERNGLGSTLTSVDALCLSANIADACADLPWRRLRVAARAELMALLALLDGVERRC
jgi:uroporphyrinogen-III synthase